MRHKILDEKWIKYTIELSRKCPPTDSAFAVGAVIIDEHGTMLTNGFSRETNAKIHAEEAALKKLRSSTIDLSQCILYSSLEPCNQRLSGATSCMEHILASGIKRIIFAAYEPPIFTKGTGMERLQKAGIETGVISKFTTDVIALQHPTIQTLWKKML